LNFWRMSGKLEILKVAFHMNVSDSRVKFPCAWLVDQGERPLWRLEKKEREKTHERRRHRTGSLLLAVTVILPHPQGAVEFCGCGKE